MQSSFKVIKNSNMSQGRRDINTNFNKPEAHLSQNDTVIYRPMESYENIGNTIINEAKKKSELILSSTYQELEKMRKEVYESAFREGYEQGAREGLKRAYEEGYRENIARAEAEAKDLMDNAENMLSGSQELLNSYLSEKETEIKYLIQNAVETILRREVMDKESMNLAVKEVLETYKDTKSFIIRCCSLYHGEIKSKVDNWKEKLPFKGEIHVICDDSLNEGSVVVKRDNGSTEISIEQSLDKLRDIMFSEE